MLSRAERLARGGIVGGFATATAAVSHAVAGGYSPNALSLIAGALFSGMLATFAIGRRPSLPRLAVVVGIGQLAFHLLFSLLGGGSATPDPGRMPMADMGPVSVHPAMAAHDHLADPRMWLAHTVAAVLTIAFLRRVEQAVWSLLHDVLVFAVRALGLAVVHPDRPLSRLSARPPVLSSLAEVTAISQRGPPLLVSF